MTRMKWLMAAVLVTTGLGAVSPAPAQPPRSSAETAYRLAAGDKIKVSVYNSDKLTGEYPVADDGKIAFPMLGRVPVKGLTLQEVTELLTTELTKGFLQNPNVSVDMVGYRPVYILGEIGKPGQYPYADNMTVYQLVALAGGFTYRANRKTIKLRRENDAAEHKATISNGTPVKPGDTIIILQRYF